MMPTTLALLSPLDTRYAAKVEALLPYMTEYALIKYRVKTELAWLKALAQSPMIPEVGPFQKKRIKKSMPYQSILLKKNHCKSKPLKCAPIMM